MKKLFTAVFIVMLMACICIGGALFVQAQDGSGDPASHTHTWSYNFDTNIATCTVDNCDATCDHEGTLDVTPRDSEDKHTLVCSACGYEETNEDCYGGTAADCQHLPECVVCEHPYGNEYGTVHTGVLTLDENPHDDPEQYHVMVYTCCGRKVDQAHTAGMASTCQKGTICAVCHNQYGAKNPNNHEESSATKLPLSATHHQIVCKCGAQLRTEAHRGGTATCAKQASCTDCGASYGSLGLDHTYTNNCDADCNECGATRTPSDHVFGAWETTKQPTETEAGEKKRICSVCGEKETEVIAATDDPNASGDSEDPKGVKTSTVVIIVVVAVLVVAGGAVAAVLLVKKKKEVADEAEVIETIETTEEAEATEETEAADAPEEKEE